MTQLYQNLSAVPKDVFHDFDFLLRLNPVTHDLLQLDTAGSIRQALKLLVLTNYYERPFQCSTGSNISAAEFDLYTPELEIYLRVEIARVITVFEPRAELQDVVVGWDNDNQTIRARVTFRVIGQVDLSAVDLIFKRVS